MTTPAQAVEQGSAYQPNQLLDTIMEKLGLKNDAALSRALEVAPPVISKIRRHRIPVGATMMIRIHDVAALSLDEIRDYLGVKPQARHQGAAA